MCAKVLLKRSRAQMQPEHAAHHQQYIDRYLTTGVAKIIGQGRRLLAVCKSGAVIPIRLWVSEGRTRADHFFVGVVRNITQEVQAEQALANQKRILEGFFLSSVSLITVSPTGIILTVNEALCATFGYRREEVVGASVNVLMPVSVAERHDMYLRQYLSTGTKKIIGIGREVTVRESLLCVDRRARLLLCVGPQKGWHHHLVAAVS